MTGTSWETSYYVLDSGREGPRVAIISGMHGDELSGPLAADQIRSWPIQRGQVAIVPRANMPALETNSRSTPRTGGDPAINLNRVFPPRADSAKTSPLPAELWSWLRKFKPDYLLDLHEGTRFRAETTNSVGNTIISSSQPQARRMGRILVDALNASLETTNHHFLLLRNPIKGSLARAAADELGICSMIVETTRQGQPLALRVRQQRVAVRACLKELGMLGEDSVTD